MKDEIKKIKDKIYINNEYIRYMFANLSMEDNLPEVYRHYEEQGEKVLQWELDLEKLNINLQDLKEKTETSFEQMAEQLKFKVKEDDVCAELSVETDKIYIHGRKLTIDADNIKINETGLWAKGTVYAGAGDIGGWQIEENTLKGQQLNDGNISTISGGTITAESGVTSYVDVEALDFNPNYDEETYQVDMCNATVSTTHDSDEDTAFGSITVLGEVELTGESSLECEDLECTSLVARGSKYFTIFCDEIITEEESWSDERLKKDIEGISGEESEKFIMALKPKKYAYKKNGRRGTGFIAQDVKELSRDYPTMVTEQKGYYGLCYRQIIPFMVGAIQENMKRLERQERYEGL